LGLCAIGWAAAQVISFTIGGYLVEAMSCRPTFALGVPSAIGAAHKDDLRAAQRAGLKAAFVTRPYERGPDHTPDLTPDLGFEVNASDFNDLAAKLGV
jgi:hypothetical protein